MTDVLFPLMSEADGATGVIVTWFVESGDEVTPTTLIAEVAVDKVDAEVYPPTSGVITLLVEENTETRQGAVIAQVT
jgi:Pyruvate/2-oxoglutarate dehydrogenase complex, dihydrolipoamide acyltransferase (E2) component, and related enzymes